MHALLAGWRVSLRRTRADWPIVAAAWLITLLAATLLDLADRVIELQDGRVNGAHDGVA